MAKHDDVIEIRVHGVSNTPPESILDIPESQLVGIPPEPTISDPPVRLKQVAGDKDTSLWRAKPDRVSEDHRVVAYSWGKLTSGRDRAAKDMYRALWMVLLPFAFVNVALWTRPPHQSSSQLNDDHRGPSLPPQEPPENRPVRTSGPLAWGVRLFALTSTATLALTAIAITLDQVVWQWIAAPLEDVGGSDAAGVANVRWLGFLRDGWWGEQTRPIAVGAGAAALVIILIYWVARRSFQYEDEISQVQDVTAPGVTGPARTSLHAMERKWFWRGNAQVSNLAFLHLATALAVITGWTARPTSQATHGASGAWQHSLMDVCFWISIGVVVIAVLLLISRGVVERAAPLPISADASRPRRLLDEVWGQRWAACAAVAGANLLLLLGSLLLFPIDIDLPAGSGGMLWFDDAIAWLALAQAILIAAVGIGAWLRRPSTEKTWRVAWFGLGPAVLLTVGWLLGLLYSAVTLFYCADFLNGEGKPFGSDSTIRLPAALRSAATSVVPYLTFAALVGLGVVIYLAVRTRHSVQTVLDDYPSDPATSHQKHRARDVARARAISDFLGTHLLWVVGLLVAVAYAFAWVGIALAFIQPDQELLLRRANEAPDVLGVSATTIEFFNGLGARVLLLLALVLALIASQVYRGGQSRKVLGVVWDIATFWPRSGHPWAPPCYAERTVPQLVTYIANREVGPNFILAGHSQGSVICAAALWQLPPQHRERCALLTFGTQLRGFYGRAFPAYFGRPLLQDLAESLSSSSPNENEPANRLRWQSLRRKTDPIGYSIDLSADVDQDPLTDPAGLSAPTDNFVDPPILGHGTYMADDTFAQVADNLAAQLLRVPAD